jgi:hypothetical protein
VACRHMWHITSTTPLKFFTGVFRRWHDCARFLTFTDAWWCLHFHSHYSGACR